MKSSIKSHPWVSFLSIIASILLTGLQAEKSMINEAGKSKLYVGDLIKALGKSKQSNGFSEIAAFSDDYPAIYELLRYEENITFFAPTNLAIKNRGTLAPENILDILKYHIAIGDIGTYKTAPQVNVVDTALNSASSLVKLPPNTAQKLVILNDDQKNLILLYGSKTPAVTLQDAFQCANGKVYPITSFLLPPINPVVTASVFGMNLFMESLANAALATEYTSVKGLTLFIPKTEALKDYLFRHPKMRMEQLAFLLRHHACREIYYTNLMRNNMKIQSDAQLDLTLETTDGINFTVNRVPIITPNIITSNGVIHIIDGLLNPFKQRNGGGVQPTGPRLGISDEGNQEEEQEIDIKLFEEGQVDNEKNDITKQDTSPEDGKVKKDLIDTEESYDDDPKTEGSKRIIADARSGDDVFRSNPASTCALFSIVIAGVLGLYM
jgi:uncharacterized surface protein with fasciclin (FAS1) repeats